MFNFDNFFRIWIYLVIGVNFFNFVVSGANAHWTSCILSFIVWIGAMYVSFKIHND